MDQPKNWFHEEEVVAYKARAAAMNKSLLDLHEECGRLTGYKTFSDRCLDGKLPKPTYRDAHECIGTVDLPAEETWEIYRDPKTGCCDERRAS